MTLTILYLDPCRLNRLRDAFSDVNHILGPTRTTMLVDAVRSSYIPHRSLRTNYNFAVHALLVTVGLQGIAAISIIKEAWTPGSLSAHRQEPIPNTTHPGLTPEGKHPIQ